MQSSLFKPTESEIVQMVKENKGNIIPVYYEISSDLLTPVSAYLKLSKDSDYSFLLESVAGGEKLGRYSFVGSNPYKIRKTGKGLDYEGDPLIPLEKEFEDMRYVKVKGLPNFTGGAIGYISYDCIKYFEPKTQRPLKDVLQLPESLLMFCDTLIIFDHLHQVIKVVSHVINPTESNVNQLFDDSCEKIWKVIDLLNNPNVPLPEQPNVTPSSEFVSNVGKEGYETMVRNLKKHIMEGDIIQAVPSQRLSKKTDLHPFNIYRRLRSLNPSPYMFYLNLKEFQLVGASPEMMVKVENKVVETHPIAGTRKRGTTPEEDERLSKELLSDEKERAEHVMLVDLGRNDTNRVSIPETVQVKSLMHIEKYSHVMHIVSNVIGTLRPEKTPFDAFRSIFPAGTVSGAPKVRAMELISEQEKETRGIYAGAVGYFSYSGDLDTCIAIRTMVVKDGTVYLQAGAGIVFDSDPTLEYEETMSKLRSNLNAIQTAEEYHSQIQKRSLLKKESEENPNKKQKSF